MKKEMEKYIVKIATSEDADKLVELMKQLRPHLNLNTFKKDLKKQIDEGYKLIYIEQNDEAAALAGFRAYNMFEWDDPECTQIRMAIKYAIADMYPDFKEKLYGRMWGSILRRGQALKPHQHNFDEYSFLSAQIVLQSEKTSTFYQNPFGLDAQRFDDEAGMLTIFPEYLLHWTDQHKNSIVPRIALGVDILTESALDDEQKQKLVEM